MCGQCFSWGVFFPEMNSALGKKGCCTELEVINHPHSIPSSSFPLMNGTKSDPAVTCGLCFFAAAGLRTPLAVPGPYPTPFGMVPHAGMNGELTSPGAAYASLHNMSPQMSAAAAAAAVVAYGRSPMVGDRGA